MSSTKLTVYIGVTLLIVLLLGTCIRYCSDMNKVAHKEFGVEALLKKYEYYKDVSAQLDKKIADIKVFSVKIENMKSAYLGKSRSEWMKDDREQLSIWQSELDGIKASYNGLAAEYNASMSKFNYSFCNVGELPRGATTPLPREFKPYVEN